MFKVDLTDKTLAQELVHFDENYDVDGYIRRSGITKEVVGVGSTFWHPVWKAFQKGIDKALPDTTNHIISVSKDERRYIVYATSDTQSGMYLYGDRDQNTLGVLGSRYERLSPEVMSEKKAISYKARDGLEIEGFLTLPKGKPETNLPTIIFPHGGPISYDSDGFDYWTQFLASKGYAANEL
ncbi:alpha/beta hydrolase family protein [Thalassotalea euphylliae]|uniref:alpha/beta hydrolase family protein n=1 Tax=Thalassotalea euphylliae TaxID=1655234 RepID=UPI002163D845|nr:hypothetical protein [Thalassotalea euphylliae]